MPQRHLVTVALPTGRSGQRGRLTALFLPRLTEDGTLADYPEWRDWPRRLRGLPLQVLLDGNIVPPHRVRRTGPAPDRRVWRALFPTTTRVDAHAYIDRTGTKAPGAPPTVKSFNATAALERVADLYASLAVAHADGPPSRDALDALPAAGALATEAGEARDHHAPIEGTEPDDAPTPDFHAWLSLVAAHPFLLRVLGLAVDLEVRLPATAPSVVQVRVNWPSGFGRTAAPMTALTPGFLALPNPAAHLVEQVDGWLRCDDPDWGLHQLTIADVAGRLAPIGDEDPDDREGTGALPPLRDAGLGLLHADAAGRVLAKMARSNEIEVDIQDQLVGAAPDPANPLYAEDLASGLRVDVTSDADATDTWRSLFQRMATAPYEFPRDVSVGFTPPPDEGMAVPVVTTEMAEVVTKVVRNVAELAPFTTLVHNEVTRADPAIVRWNGWSLAAPKPSMTWDDQTKALVPAPTNEPDTTMEVQLGLDHAVLPGSLPRLRYGDSYRMRARAVDLAGNSLPPSAANPLAAVSPEAFYGRLMPVPSPLVLRRGAAPVPGVGEDALTIVLLSDHDLPDDKVEPVERQLLPAKVGQWLCELHGEPKGGNDPGSYGLLAARDAVNLEGQSEVDDSTGDRIWGTRTRKGITPGKRDADPGWLPDPAQAGVVLGPFAGTKGSFHVRTDLHGSWPSLQGAAIRFAAGTAGPTIPPEAEIAFHVEVPKAARWDLVLAPTIRPELVKLFDLIHRQDDDDRAALEEQLAVSSHWMLTAQTRLHVVHAVRRPLLAPTIRDLVVHRSLGSAAMDVDVHLTVSDVSTATTAVRASVFEIQDDPTTGRLITERTLPIGRFETAVDGVDDEDHLDHHVRLRSTQRVELAADAEAYSAFARYFTQSGDVTTVGGTALVDPAGVHAPLLRVRHGDEELRAGADFTLDAVAGELRDLSVLDGTTLQVDWVARPVSRLSTETANVFKVVVPASVPPKPPELVDVAVAHASGTLAGATSLRHTRDGRALRFVLASPWWTSGDREALAIVVDESGAAVPSRTRFARDPLASTSDAGRPSSATMPWAGTYWPAVDGTTDGAAVHEVTHDPATGTWFVDVAFLASGYRPWVRPTIARWQPDAVAGAHLSPVVPVDPVRLGLYRDSIVATSAKGGAVVVTVTGTDHDGIPDDLGVLHFNEVVATFQERDREVADPDLGWVDVGAPATLARTAHGSWTTSLVPPAAGPLRLVLVETEPAVRDDGSGAVLERDVVFVESFDLPEEWTAGAGGGGLLVDAGATGGAPGSGITHGTVGP